ncbi:MULTISPECIES: lytic transglycosylase domain-containing protein [unclassified Variovorax]|uniref:lytic transglycosylase domain-containing protein n=1 Tax=unclassified Variovorax TaxID=663243 RepID=UPI002B22C517|nr:MULTISPECIES: lytic transglycosylase domain-containing protein [unclassified Variovorax]MEB0056153.1 lytic transglycosylase domain-containing protein [Variovorax sp. LG9.2]MEB0110067.1 lytic transglycosylase domain-containing protein [Variovorax sp. RTB1]
MSGRALPAPLAARTVPGPAALSRRRLVLGASLAPLAMSIHQSAHAGAQIEEPLIDSVRTALSSAIHNKAPPIPEFSDTESRLSYLRWLGAMSERLLKKVPDWPTRKELLQTIWYESKRSGLDVSLVLGLVQVESNFRKFAVSSAGARGYMQVMPFWTRVIGDSDPTKLFHMQTNLRFGCVILRHYLQRENGDLFMTLGRYNGSRGRSPYPDAVFANQRPWLFADRTPDKIPPVAPPRG